MMTPDEWDTYIQNATRIREVRMRVIEAEMEATAKMTAEDAVRSLCIIVECLRKLAELFKEIKERP